MRYDRVLVAFTIMAAQALHLGAENLDTMSIAGFSNPASWYPTESSIHPEVLVEDGYNCLLWVAPVDHEGGEIKHPIGWPRVNFKPSPVESSWFLYDNFSVKVKASIKSGGDKPIPMNMTFSMKDAEKGFIKQLKLPPDEWQTVDLPIRELHDPAVLVWLRCNIAEANFAHGDELKFYFTGAELTRSRDCNLDALSAGAVVNRGGKRVLPVRTTMSGPSSDMPRGIPFRISKGGETVRLETLPVVRGDREWFMDVSELPLTAGEYSLTAFPDNAERSISADFSVGARP